MTEAELAAIEKLAGFLALRCGTDQELVVIPALVAEVRRLREYEFMYKELCK